MAKQDSRPAATGMLCPRAIHKPARPSVSKSINFPIDKLPTELIHMICAHLEPMEVANLRLVSRLVGPIGLQYMVSEVHLFLAKDSFEQLKALAKHPIASKYVTSFFFEADRIGVLPREHWEPLVPGPQYGAQFEELPVQGHPCPRPTERSLRTFRRKLSKLTTAPRHHYTKEEMDDAFGKYLDFTHFQQDPSEVAVQEKEVAEAMKHFPSLKELTIATQCSTRAVSSRLKKTFEQAFCYYYQADDPRDAKLEPLGLPQTRAVLLGAYHAGLKLETLNCGVVSWRILKEDSETFAHMKASVMHLKTLQLDFNYDDWRQEKEIEFCCTYLEAGRLTDFIAAAPNLEHLQIGFQCTKLTYTTQLKHIVGEHHWPSLKTVHFKKISSTEDDLVSFCRRHADTLRSLHLSSITFDYGDGEWVSAFNRMRKVLTLDTITVSGRLEGSPQFLDLGIHSEEYSPWVQDGIQAFFTGPVPGDGMGLSEFLDAYDPDASDMSDYDVRGVHGWW